MNILMNKNISRIKRVLVTTLALASLVAAPLLITGEVYADPPCEGVNARPGCVPPAEPLPETELAPYGTDATCTAGPTACVPAEPDPTYKSDALDCDGDNPPGTEQVGEPDPDCNLFSKYVNPFIKLLAGLTGIAVVIGVIYGGIMYASSGGDAQQVSKAKIVIRNSVIALIVYMFLWALLEFLLPGDVLIG
jgi:hypothetical protein